jgi:fatty acid-binding protein DegV
MQKKHLNFLVLAAIMSIASAKASPAVTISALKSPVWVLQGSSRTELGPDSKLKIGDNIATGDAGRVEIQLWINARLQLNSNSEITFRAANRVGQAAADAQPELYIREGRACVSYTAQSSGEAKFVINIGDMMFAAIHLRGDICVLRADGQSSIKLRGGSVQVTHAVDPNMIILSEIGTEFHIEDDGSFKLLFPGDDVSALEIEKPFIVEKVTPADPSEIAATGQIDTGELTVAEFEAAGEEEIDSAVKNKAATDGVRGAAPEASPWDDVPGYIYTVYLFSSRDKEVAEQVNRRFQQAGHDTRIIESTTGSVLHYRVVAPGFESMRTARNFSDAITGTLGVTETWIGKEKSSVGDAAIAEDRPADPADSDNIVSRESTAAQTGTSKQEGLPNYIYTVYLFSTRNKEVAEQFSRRFQQAGHDTRVVESTTGSVLHYRVVAPGFESRQAAQNFSAAIAATFGVTDAWIGKDKSSVDAAAVVEDTADDPARPGDEDNVAIVKGAAAQAGTNKQDGTFDHLYTVYLFSTRNKEVAEQFSRRFQQAGHDTRVVESTTGSVLHYRVVAPGFESRRAAQNFSATIAGTFGVTDAWIGKGLK